MTVTHLHHEVDKSLKKLYQDETPINVYVEFYCHSTLVGTLSMGDCILARDKGNYRVKNTVSDFTFNCLYASFANGGLLLTYNLQYDWSMVS